MTPSPAFTFGKQKPKKTIIDGERRQALLEKAKSRKGAPRRKRDSGKMALRRNTEYDPNDPASRTHDLLFEVCAATESDYLPSGVKYETRQIRVNYKSYLQPECVVYLNSRSLYVVKRHDAEPVLKENCRLSDITTSSLISIYGGEARVPSGEINGDEYYYTDDRGNLYRLMFMHDFFLLVRRKFIEKLPYFFL